MRFQAVWTHTRASQPRSRVYTYRYITNYTYIEKAKCTPPLLRVFRIWPLTTSLKGVKNNCDNIITIRNNYIYIPFKLLSITTFWYFSCTKRGNILMSHITVQNIHVNPFRVLRAWNHTPLSPAVIIVGYLQYYIDLRRWKAAICWNLCTRDMDVLKTDLNLWRSLSLDIVYFMLSLVSQYKTQRS